MIGHIFKYKISTIGEIVEIELPVGAQICDINSQDEEIFIWALIDIRAPKEKIELVVYGTGWQIQNLDKLYFLKTVHMKSGLVWHVFTTMKSFLSSDKMPIEASTEPA